MEARDVGLLFGNDGAVGRLLSAVRRKPHSRARVRHLGSIARSILPIWEHLAALRPGYLPHYNAMYALAGLCLMLLRGDKDHDGLCPMVGELMPNEQRMVIPAGYFTNDADGRGPVRFVRPCDEDWDYGQWVDYSLRGWWSYFVVRSDECPFVTCDAEGCPLRSCSGEV